MAREPGQTRTVRLLVVANLWSGVTFGGRELLYIVDIPNSGNAYLMEGASEQLHDVQDLCPVCLPRVLQPVPIGEESRQVSPCSSNPVEVLLPVKIRMVW
jgi:hypothetical protein